MTLDDESKRIAAIARDEYLKAFPILAAYLDILREYNTRTTPINELPTEPAGLNNLKIAKMALERIGRPARDWHDVQMAEVWVRHLNDELVELSPKVEKDIAEWVTYSIYPLAEFVPSVQDWDNMTLEDRDDLLDSVVQDVPHDDQIDVFKETLAYAMPGILAEITRRDQHHLRAV